MELTIIPTWKCQIKPACPYCDYLPAPDGSSVQMVRDKTLQIGEELTPDQWVGWLKTLPPSTINFTGGEPLMYKGFRELIRKLPDKHRWAITSNTLLDVINIEPLLCLTWTASFHPSQGEEKITRFIQNIHYLRASYFSMSISIVAYPDMLDKLPDYVQGFQKAGFKVGILPFYTRGWDWRESGKYEEIRKFLPLVEENPNLWWVENRDLKQCSAGNNYLTIQPDGDAWRCYSGFIQLEQSHRIGNILTGLKDVDTACSIPCLFPCDWLRSKKGEEAVNAAAGG